MISEKERQETENAELVKTLQSPSNQILLGLLAPLKVLTVNKDAVLNTMKTILPCFCSSFIAAGDGCYNDGYVNSFHKMVKLYQGKIYEHEDSTRSSLLLEHKNWHRKLWYPNCRRAMVLMLKEVVSTRSPTKNRWRIRSTQRFGVLILLSSTILEGGGQESVAQQNEVIMRIKRVLLVSPGLAEFEILVYKISTISSQHAVMLLLLATVVALRWQERQEAREKKTEWHQREWWLPGDTSSLSKICIALVVLLLMTVHDAK